MTEREKQPGAANSLDIDYRRLIEHIPAIIYIAAWDATSSTIYTSPQIEQLLGFTQDEWMADHMLWLTQIHPEDRDFVLEQLAHIHAGGKPQPCEYRMLTRAGQVRWFRDDAAVMRSDDGEACYLYGVMFDITEQKQMKAALDEARRQLWDACKPHLDEHELVVLRLVRNHYTDREIGRKLAVSERTVRNYLKAICAKLAVVTRRDAVREADRLNLLEE